MTDSVHKWGSLAGVELCHAGGIVNALYTALAVSVSPRRPEAWSSISSESRVGIIAST